MYSKELIQKGQNLFKEISDKLNTESASANIIAVFGKDYKANQEVSTKLNDQKTILDFTPIAITLESIINDNQLTPQVSIQSLINSGEQDKKLV